jgi:flagellar motor switch/type III secretory pathway protein FliN
MSALLPPDRGEGGVGNASSGPAPKHFPESSPLAGLPMQLDVTIPISRFRVRDLLALDKGSILESQWQHTDDVPVWCGGSQLVWSEFEVIDEELAVRVTRLG